MALVLVVDDEQDNRDLFERALEVDGHTVITASDGRDGLLKALIVEKCKVVVTDLTMPRLRGDGMLVAMKAAEVLPPSVVIVSGDISSPEETDKLGLELSGILRPALVAVLAKPVPIAHLQEAVRLLLKERPV